MTITIAPLSGTYLEVVKITDTIGGINYVGSGVLISPDEVLTASHVLYTQGIGAATNIKVTPGGNAVLGTFTAASIHYNAVADEGDTISFENAQSDYAIIHLSKSVDGVGYMGLGEGYSLGGPATTTGFPKSFGNIEMTASGTAAPVDGYTLLQIPALGPGSSGGPVWIANSDGTAAVVATASIQDGAGNQYGPEMTASEVAQIQRWLAADGETQTLSNLGKTMVTTDQNGAVVANLYEGIMGRAPDSLGEVYYHSAVNAGTETFPQVATAMLSSPEFTSAHAGETAVQFVGGLYQEMLGRQGSQAEVAYYVGLIGQGVSEARVAVNFAQSPEAISHVQAWLFVA